MPCQKENEQFMRRCLELASQGLGKVAPNPMVGSVLVHKHSIIGEGFHQSFGEAHAEPIAINRVTNEKLLKNSTLYVNLEPCSHYGKTPPCANLIIEKNIPEVIIGITDPNELVSGNGIRMLRENGVSVITGILENECKTLNRRYFTWHLKKRPYIILKWARSADGFIDMERPPGTPVGPNWITSQIGRTLVHKWRAEEQAILIGTTTVLKDNPRLNVRDWSGKNPLRVIIDRSLKIGSNHKILSDSEPALVITEKKRDDKGKTKYVQIIFDNTAELQILELLYMNNIQSLIIEGGAFTLSRFIEKGLWDEARIFTGSNLFRKGVKSPAIRGKSIKSHILDNNLLEILYND